MLIFADWTDNSINANISYTCLGTETGIQLVGNVSYRLSLKTVSLFAVSCSVIGLLYLHLSHIQLHDILYTISYVLSFRIVFFFAEEQERVQKKTFTNWINSYLSKVSSLSIQCYSIYVSIYRISIDLPLKFAYQDVRRFFFPQLRWVLLIEGSAGRDHEVDIANILSVDEMHEIVN